ncbi:hypothetical protein EK21DRAFT_106616 [Setomelanomma holmii]|uniref:Uncharacterized protein n=1 Tax=Setomelanomma holmii TaxID=210430 RepID=A0A9P4HKM8_9PLEO|nr:hypothetical protein EK21DRAFT_106616 [Setomelanomma holmii]
MSIPTELSPFLRLPAELRNKIYAYVLHVGQFRIFGKQQSAKDFTMLVQTDPLVPFSAIRPPAHLFAIIAACRQIRNETRLLPFQFNPISSLISPVLTTSSPPSLRTSAMVLARSS